jgi:3D (Asp-Asp-Asp) domain-containing protein
LRAISPTGYRGRDLAPTRLMSLNARTATVLVVVLLSSTLGAQARPRPRTTPWLPMSATAYCQQGITGSGVHTQRGMVAVDPRRIPLGSSIHVRGLKGVRDGIYAATDTGAAVKNNEIDVFIPDCRAAKAFGRQRVQVRIVRRGPVAGESVAANR